MKSTRTNLYENANDTKRFHLALKKIIFIK